MKKVLFLSLFVTAIMFMIPNSAQAEVKTLTSENFKTEISSSGYVLVDFWATWCPPCRKLGPILEELSNDFDGKIKFTKLDVDKAKDIAAMYNIRSLPTIILFKDAKPVDAWIGYREKEDLANILRTAITKK